MSTAKICTFLKFPFFSRKQRIFLFNNENAIALSFQLNKKNAKEIKQCIAAFRKKYTFSFFLLKKLT
jgi:hypothetical protein